MLLTSDASLAARFGSETWFGVNLIADTPGATVRVGDPVEVLGTRDGSEPLR